MTVVLNEATRLNIIFLFSYEIKLKEMIAKHVFKNLIEC